jgi:chloramphenicol 3-O-phosphotransferase
MSRLFFLCGPARSGKSTVAKKWANYEVDVCSGDALERKGGKAHWESPRAIVNADTIRLQFGHRFYGPIEELVHTFKHMMIKVLLDSGHDVLVDGTHTTKHSIVKLLEIDSDAEHAFVSTPADVCKERAVATDQTDLLPVIDRMVKQMEDLPPIGEIRQEIKARKK